MTIDIQLGDTFTINPDSVIRQTRGNKRRRFGDAEWWTGSVAGEAHLSMDVARQIITAAGHTVQEVQPPPTPVPWPTHAVVQKTDPGLIEWTGSLDACNEHARGAEANYEVRPLAPAPLSPAMRAFIGSFLMADVSKKIADTAKSLLAEGGAK